MKKTFTLLILILTLMYVKAMAQTPTIKPFKLNENQVLSRSSVYQENLNYSEFELDKNELGKINQNINKCNLEFTLSNNKTLVVVLNRFDIWDKNFEVKNEKGEKMLVEKGNVFQGYLKDDTTARVAVSIFNNSIDILIETKKGKYSLTSNFKTNIYTFEDVVNAEGNSCPVNDKLDIKIDENIPNATVECKTFIIDLVTDLNLWNYYGNIDAVYQRVVTVFNQMTIPFHEQNVGIKMGRIRIYNTSLPLDYSNNITLLNSFNSWYSSNLAHPYYHVGQLFTTYYYSTSPTSRIVGTSTSAYVCNAGINVNWSKVNDSYGYKVAAHELGHSLGAPHTSTGSIMESNISFAGNYFDTPTGNLFRGELNICGHVDNSVPTNLQTSNITVTSAVLSWARTPTSTYYSAYYRKVGDSNWIAVGAGPSTTVTLTGLLSGIQYEWLAQGDCSDGSSPITFTTAVNATISAGITNSAICPNENVTINVITGGEINVGNTFTAQLSDAAGNFLNPTIIGTLFSKYSGTMQIKIPGYIAAGSNYKIRVVGNSPSVTGVETNITIKPTPAPPILTLSAANLFCNNNPINIAASNCSGTLTWNLPITATGNTVSIIPTDNTAYSAKCTGSNGCKSEKVTPVFKKINTGTQNSVIQWEKSFGGTLDDDFLDAIKTIDGGYLLAGASQSGLNGNKLQIPRGGKDAVLIKIDANGNRLWEKIYGGSENDYITRIIQTSDNNYLMLLTSSSGIEFEKTSANKGGFDAWVIKINANGDIIWQVSMGSDTHEYAQEIEPTSDGGYLIGSTITPFGTATGAANGDRTQAMKSLDADFWVVKLNANGVKIWDKVYGGTATESMWDIQKATNNSGYFITGYTSSASGVNSDITTSARHSYDGWLLKIDGNGNKIFDKTYSGGTTRSDLTFVNYSYEFITAIKPLPDGNYLLSIASNNHAGNEKSENSMGGLDTWFVKITPNGTKISDRVIGGNSHDANTDMLVLNDGSIVVTMNSRSEFSTDKNDALKGMSDAWLVKLDQNLNIIYSKTFGGFVGTDPDRSENLYKILNDDNDNFIGVGYANETKGDRSDAFGQNDAWVLKVNIPSITKPTISSNTTLVCPGESITLTANGCTSTILWSNGAKSNSIVVKPNSGDNTYRVNCLTNANACIGLDSDVFRVNVAASDLTLTGNAVSGTRQAKGTIVSRQIINNGVNVTYKAGKSILLDKNQTFEAKAGSVFKAEIATCNLEEGMVGYYPFNGNVQDLSGNNRNGVLSGALYTKDRFGKSNSALSFDGIDDKVSLNYAYSGYQELTISAWINTKDLTDIFQAILSTNGAEFTHFQLYQSNNGALGWYYTSTADGVNEGFHSFSSDMPYNPKNAWAHIVLKIKSGDSKVFLNGQIVKTNTSTYNFITATNLLKIGNGYQDGRYFKGEIDDLRIYERALSDAEVIALYKSEAPNPSLNAGLFANYKFDGNANDVSGKGNNGTIAGGATFTTDRYGQANKALDFDGINDYVSVPNNNTLSGFNELTMSAWINHNLASNVIGNIISKWRYPDLSQMGYILNVTNHNFNFYTSDNTTFHYVIPTTTISPNIWYHVVVTQNQDGQKVFINGVLAAVSTTNYVLKYTFCDLLIGVHDNATTGVENFYKGKIDDIKLYNRALSPLEVIQLYDLEKP